MPRLLVRSDLHLEFGESSALPPEDSFDICVLAGDIAPGLRGLEWAMEKFPVKPVLYCFGNHEFYGHATPRLFDKARALAPENIRILENSEAVIDGVRFLGATLWTDFLLSGQASSNRALAGKEMNDYSRIRVSPIYRKLSPADTSAMHAGSRSFLSRALATPFPGKTVVITHHAPHPMGLGKGGDLDSAYASDLTAVLSAGGAELWVHGHTHVSMSYEVGGMQILSNARGYPEENPAFRPDLIIDTASLARNRHRPATVPLPSR